MFCADGKIITSGKRPKQDNQNRLRSPMPEPVNTRINTEMLSSEI
jgi:hypothetical protein